MFTVGTRRHKYGCTPIRMRLFVDELKTENINAELAEAEYRSHPTVLNRGMDLHRESIFEPEEELCKFIG